MADNVIEFDPDDPMGLRDENGEFPWHYRCSLCGTLVRPDDVTAHHREERAKPGYEGQVGFERVDD